ncbi:MAG: hypothetical protein NZ602_14725, partial [Thermoguttaceae bacterium]|nr:hypothetical protein [Thermoguttaceae bacterium]
RAVTHLGPDTAGQMANEAEVSLALATFLLGPPEPMPWDVWESLKQHFSPLGHNVSFDPRNVRHIERLVVFPFTAIHPALNKWQQSTAWGDALQVLRNLITQIIWQPVHQLFGLTASGGDSGALPQKPACSQMVYDTVSMVLAWLITPRVDQARLQERAEELHVEIEVAQRILAQASLHHWDPNREPLGVFLKRILLRPPGAKWPAQPIQANSFRKTFLCFAMDEIIAVRVLRCNHLKPNGERCGKLIDAQDFCQFCRKPTADAPVYKVDWYFALKDTGHVLDGHRCTNVECQKTVPVRGGPIFLNTNRPCPLCGKTQWGRTLQVWTPKSEILGLPMEPEQD